MFQNQIPLSLRPPRPRHTHALRPHARLRERTAAEARNGQMEVDAPSAMLVRGTGKAALASAAGEGENGEKARETERKAQRKMGREERDGGERDE